ncbi:thioredoxin-1-like [Gigantopelta aegis]|uniref:thioredoxin-1-like n=1 Tax=Gigantopelta aegis TaxID=1735272 RepID=UPI001B88B212|nr:thioredoxin-1-like [Gigantopelta aegis]
MALIVIHSKDEFDAALNDFDGLVVVDFYADWCGPCRMIAPKFQDFATKYSDCRFLKVNVDEAEDVSQSCSIQAMPTFHLYKNKQKVGEVVGADANKLEDLIKKNK